MNYQFRFTYTEMMNAPVVEDLNVELTAEEVSQIQHCVNPDSKQPADEQLRRRLKKVYQKIIAAGYPMCQSVMCHGIRLLDMGNDIAWEPVDYDALLQEDVQKGFVATDENGRPYCPEELLREWVKWEDQQLSALSHAERVKFYADRYHYAVDGILDNKLATLRFELPPEIDVTGPTDSWLKGKLRRWL